MAGAFPNIINMSYYGRALCYRQAGGVCAVLAALSSLCEPVGFKFSSIFELIFQPTPQHLPMHLDSHVIAKDKKYLKHIGQSLVDSETINLFPTCNHRIIAAEGGERNKRKESLRVSDATIAFHSEKEK
eukprot:3482436-Ditylum_brightwellii.AAC.1